MFRGERTAETLGFSQKMPPTKGHVRIDVALPVLAEHRSGDHDLDHLQRDKKYDHADIDTNTSARAKWWDHFAYRFDRGISQPEAELACHHKPVGRIESLRKGLNHLNDETDDQRQRIESDDCVEYCS